MSCSCYVCVCANVAFVLMFGPRRFFFVVVVFLSRFCSVRCMCVSCLHSGCVVCCGVGCVVLFGCMLRFVCCVCVVCCVGLRRALRCALWFCCGVACEWCGCVCVCCVCAFG